VSLEPNLNKRSLEYTRPGIKRQRRYFGTGGGESASRQGGKRGGEVSFQAGPTLKKNFGMAACVRRQSKIMGRERGGKK